MCKEIQYIESIFPEYFQESAQSEGDVQEHNFQFPVNPEMEVNNEDGNIVQNIPGYFKLFVTLPLRPRGSTIPLKDTIPLGPRWVF